ncbi:Biosynthetic arginine decarboxylase [Candidatus Methylacidithermus pantelleriae]|uniref:Biosynthetic arginine decarboxylase n=2 Tax=Candidatus Methylacidithermus pantelleriae TaxID=2744239 RepID=A0A8J2BNI9_9BACT|nr:Biosynthetic arginine decarboxylase [Candidatus Methylacidithermus pantelleriae]
MKPLVVLPGDPRHLRQKFGEFCFSPIVKGHGGFILRAMTKSSSAWGPGQSAQLYGVTGWGAGYFSVNARGHVSVRPVGENGPELDLWEVVEASLHRGLELPILLRFQDLLRHRVQELHRVFEEAAQEAGYQGGYQAVFPIKVNQLREVVEEILDAGAPYHHGLEVGSKPELFAALAMHRDPESLIVCNGYKDRAFIEAALLGRKLGKRIFLVVEKLEELPTILSASQSLGVQPLLGIRLKLSTKGQGRWARSGGEEAKFGLSTAELLQALRWIEECGMIHGVELLHFHIGSQIPDILAIKRAVREAARYYARLRQQGVKLRYLDVGGGLGVDYDGSSSSRESSINYTLAEYARDIVYNVLEICQQEGVPHPTLVTETGRALVAHHSVLVVNVLGVIRKTPVLVPCPNGNPHKLVRDLLELKATVNQGNLLEHYHDALQIKEDAQAMFDLGLLDLSTKAQIEALYWELLERILALYGARRSIPEELRTVKDHLADRYLCNFSVFQSLIDYWGLKQVFPVMPIHRLLERPTRQGRLVDITCDSDGQIADFVGPHGEVAPTLPLHPVDKEPYYLGIFLVGAYQDIMGDLHNLFGRVNEAHVFLDPDEPGGFYIEETIPSLKIREALSLVQYEAPTILRAMKTQVDQAIRSDVLKPTEGMLLLEAYERGLEGSAYLALGQNEKEPPLSKRP